MNEVSSSIASSKRFKSVSTSKEDQKSIRSYKEASSINEEHVPLSNIYEEETEVQPEISNYKEEVINTFFYSMLDLVVVQWRANPKEEDKQSLNSKILNSQLSDITIEMKDFKNLTEDELSNYEIVAVKGSKVSLSKKQRKKSSSSVSYFSDGESKISSKTFLSTISDYDRETQISKSETIREVSNKYLNDIEFAQSININVYEDSEIVKIIFTNGGIYEGPISNKLFHGYGKYIWPDGAVYEGQFQNGTITGRGVLVYPDLSYYFGEFCCGWMHGHGTMIISRTPMMYSGNWNTGKKHGDGWLLYGPGNWYEGQFAHNKKEGSGLRQYKYGVRYMGDWHENERSGEGCMLYGNYDCYQGEWSEGLPNGYGEYTWNAPPNNTICFPSVNNYRGIWSNGLRQGAGVMHFGYKNGATLAGIWQRNLKHGAGVMICGNGVVLESNPLFMYDNPIHTNIDYSKMISSTSLGNMNQLEGKPSKATILSDLSGVKDTFMKSVLWISNQSELKYRAHISSDKVFKMLVRNLDSQVIQNEVEHIEFDQFTNPPETCSPLKIPMFDTFDNIDLTPFVQFIATQCQGNCDTTPFRTDSIIEFNPVPSTVTFGKLPPIHCKCERHMELNEIQLCWYSRANDFESLPEYYTFEEEKLRAQIRHSFDDIEYVYYSYANICVDDVKKSQFNTVLVRLFLWQMYRDINVEGFDYTLWELDELVANNPEAGVEDEHNPFEKVRLWQFVHTLLTIACRTSISNVFIGKEEGSGILANIFKYFLHDVCLPNVGKRKDIYLRKEFGPDAGKCIFDYRDMVPMQSVYEMYCSTEMPYTPRKFLLNSCVLKGQEPRCFYRSYADEGFIEVKDGLNIVPFGNSIIFVTEDDPIFYYKQQPEPPQDPYFKNMFVFRTLGPKKIVELMKSVSPLLVKEGVIVNMDYQFTFIEFYDILLACTFALVDKEKKFEEKMERRREIDKLKAEGLWQKKSKPKLTKQHKKGKEKKGKH